MGLEPGDAYDCPACGAVHEVERGKGLEVPGSSEGLAAAIYVRCPEAGVFDPAVGPQAETGGSDSGADAGNDDWP